MSEWPGHALADRAGQPTQMTIAGDSVGCGHWYSPAVVQQLVDQVAAKDDKILALRAEVEWLRDLKMHIEGCVTCKTIGYKDCIIMESLLNEKALRGEEE